MSLDIEITRARNRNYALAEGFDRMVRQANGWSLFLRYQAQAERHYRRAVEAFDCLKSPRAELPDEPISPVQPSPEPSANVAGASKRGAGLRPAMPPFEAASFSLVPNASSTAAVGML